MGQIGMSSHHSRVQGGGGDSANIDRLGLQGGGAVIGPSSGTGPDYGDHASGSPPQSAKRREEDNHATETNLSAARSIPVHLPLDVWILIGEHLEPFDLLRLTRVNKSFRHLFTSKRDSKRVWQLAFRNVRFPTLSATDWDLVALTSLLDEPQACKVCGGALVFLEIDFVTRTLYHHNCLRRLFVTPSEIVEDVDIHPDTLDCVPSLCVHVFGRKYEERYIREQVQRMSKFLYRLDSSTTVTRDRSVRKAARELRDATIAEKKKSVKDAYKDQSSIHAWKREHEKRQEKAEASRRVVRREERVNEILERLGRLGYPPEDMPSSLDVYIQADRVFLSRLPTVRTFLSNTSVIDEESESSWAAALPAIQSEVVRYSGAKGILWLRPLAIALRHVGHTLPSDLLQLTKSSETFDASWHPWRVADVQIGSLGSATRLTDDQFGQLDEIFTRFTSRVFWCCVGPHQVGSYPHIDSFRQCRLDHPSGVHVSAEWMRILFNILKETEIDDGPGNDVHAKLEALGPAFSCRWAMCSVAPSPPMTFSDLISHCSTATHARALNPAYVSSQSPSRLKVSDIVYVPRQVSVASTSSTTLAAAPTSTTS